jgi:hypothetical protein
MKKVKSNNYSIWEVAGTFISNQYSYIMKICVVAIFKNESHVLKEWLEHYLREGVDTFLLIDNDSSDNYKPILEPFLRSRQVFLKKSKKKYAQVELYNRWLPEAKKFDWVIVVDMDEFIYARNGFKTIKEYLETVNKDIYKIEIPWKLFGSSGFKKQPVSVIQNFIHRKKFPKFNTNTNLSERVINIKTISRGPHLQQIGIHTSVVTNLHKSFPVQEVSSDMRLIREIGLGNISFTIMIEPLLKTHFLHLNHYRIQSWEFFKKVKMTRGDCLFNTSKYIRTRKYFQIHDYKDMKDTELKDKKY